MKLLVKVFIGGAVMFGAIFSSQQFKHQFTNIDTPELSIEAAAEDFILEYVTTTANQSILLPFRGATNVVIDFNDGTTPVTRTIGNDMTYTYASPGTYQIKITGSMTGYGSGSSQFNTYTVPNRLLKSVIQWGDTGVTSLSGAFFEADNLTYVPADLPSTVTDLSFLFRDKSANWSGSMANISTWNTSNVTNFQSTFHGAVGFGNSLDITGWDTSSATNMREMFHGATSFNQNISTWNVGLVQNMLSMFERASLFNQPIGSWNVSSATNMSLMFRLAVVFNQPLNTWDVSQVTNFSSMFYGASAFNQDLNLWDTSSATNMNVMFRDATVFNGNITNWDVSNVTQMSQMFSGARAFNQAIGNWNVSSVTLMFEMFYFATAFNQDISTWNVGNVTNFSSMFNRASAFNQPLNTWDTKKGVDFSSMFEFNTGFNQPIDQWNVSAGTNFSTMFSYSIFNQDISSWNVGSARFMINMFRSNTVFNQPLNTWNVANVENMERMFSGATAFNQPLDQWNVGKVTNMFNMFDNARVFNQDISMWDVSKVTQFGGMFNNADAFNQPIGAWNTASAVSMSEMFAYNGAFDQYIGEWDTAKVTNFAGMFNFSVFNQDIGGWDTSSGQYFYSMFRFNDFFNQDLSGWNMGNALYIYEMFQDAKLFNSPLNTWNTSKVIQAHRMFQGATVFNQPIGNWDMSKNETTFSMFANAKAFNQDLPWTTTALVNASEMFSGATAFNGAVESFDMSKVLFANNFFQNASAFNQPIPDWNFAAIIPSSGFERMFSGASSFNQDISGWTFGRVTNFRWFMSGVNLNPLYYDAFLQAMIDQNVVIDLAFGERQIDFGSSKYSKVAKALKDQLITDYAWTILDGGQLNLTITVDDNEKYFGEEDPEFTVSYSGLVEGAGEDTLTNNFVFTRTPGEAVDTYTVSVTGGDESYYYVTYATGTFSILKPTLNLDLITWDYETSFTYDGTGKTVSLENVPSAITVTYVGNTATNAGDYTASVTISYDPDTYDIVGSIPELFWVIDQATYDLSNVTWSYTGTAFVYDMTEKTVTIMSGLPTGVTVTTYTGNQATAPGIYSATVVFAYDTVNYEMPTLEPFAWEIFAATYTLNFDTRGGSTLAPITGIFGTAVTAPSNPTRTGFTFNGWSPSLPTTMPNHNLTLTASWLAINTNDLTSSGLFDVVDLTAFEGQDITLALVIDILNQDSLSEEDIAILKDFFADEIGGGVESFIYDIRLLVESQQGTVSITELTDGFDVTIQVPEDMQGKTIYVVQYLDGVATLIEGVYDETNQTIRFRVSGLGQYVLAYQEQTFNLFTALSIGGGTILAGLLGWWFFILGKRRKPKQEKAVVADTEEEDESMEQVEFFQKPIQITTLFYEGLTPGLQSEFKSLFIDEVPTHLVKELTYTIGAKNEAFFTLVYKFLYRYRKLISLGLLEALISYGLNLSANAPKTQTLIYEVGAKIAYARRSDRAFLDYTIALTRKDIALQRNTLNPRNKFVYSFYRLSIILEKQKLTQEALVLVNEAIARNLEDKTKSGYQGRKLRLVGKK